MSYQQKYHKYKKKYLNLLQKAGAETEISPLLSRLGIKPELEQQSNPILYVNLIRVVSKDNTTNLYKQHYDLFKSKCLT